MKRTRGLHLNDPCVKGSCVHSFKRTFRQEIIFFFLPFNQKRTMKKSEVWDRKADTQY